MGQTLRKLKKSASRSPGPWKLTMASRCREAGPIKVAVMQFLINFAGTSFTAGVVCINGYILIYVSTFSVSQHLYLFSETPAVIWPFKVIIQWMWMWMQMGPTDQRNHTEHHIYKYIWIPKRSYQFNLSLNQSTQSIRTSN